MLCLAPSLPVGSPAYAGIDRVFVDALFVVQGFPRLRGDRPHSYHPYEDGTRVPPPTRG